MKQALFAIPFAVALATVPGTVQACSLPPNYRSPTEGEQEMATRRNFRNAAAVVEVVAETGSVFPRAGRMRVLRVYKGNVRVGMRLAVQGVPGSMCGHGDFPAGSRGILMFHRLTGQLFFSGFTSAAHVAMLRREGLLPPR